MYLHLTDFKADCYFGEGHLKRAVFCQLYSRPLYSTSTLGEKCGLAISLSTLWAAYARKSGKNLSCMQRLRLKLANKLGKAETPNSADHKMLRWLCGATQPSARRSLWAPTRFPMLILHKRIEGSANAAYEYRSKRGGFSLRIWSLSLSGMRARRK
jgi:hypothetical protein